VDVAPANVRAEAGDRSARIFFEAADPASASSTYMITATFVSASPSQAASAPLPPSPAPLVCKGCSVDFTNLVNDMGTERLERWIEYMKQISCTNFCLFSLSVYEFKVRAVSATGQMGPVSAGVRAVPGQRSEMSLV
jgi:hypothetical protein